MLSRKQIAWAYAVSAAFVAAGLVSVALDFYYLLALPFVLSVVGLLIYRPKYIYYLLAFSTPLSVHLMDERVSTLNLSLPTEPLIILLFVLSLLHLVKRKSLNFKELRIALTLLLLSDLLWVLVTTLTSSMPLISAKFLVAKTWYLLVFYFVLSRLFQDEKFAKKFIWGFILACVILAGYTLVNHSAGGFSRHYAYTAMRPFLPDHGMYAACLSFVVPVLFVFTVHGKTLNYSIPTRIVSAGIFFFLVLAVALSFTRASWLSLVIAFGVYALLRIRFPFKALVAMGVLAFGVLAWNMDTILTDLSRNKKESDDNIENHLQSVSNVSSDPSNLERLNRWSSGLRMWEDRPIVGYGPGTYTFQYGAFQLPHQMTIISTNSGSLGGIHSEYLRPLAESGGPGALLTLAIVVAVFAMGFKQNLELTGQAKYLSLAVFLGLVTYFAHGALNNYSEFDKIAVPLYSFMAVMTALEVKHANASKDIEE